MGIRRSVWLAAMFFAILVISSNAGAQEAERSGGTVQATLTPGKVTGIRTDRLKESQLWAWESILEIVLAKGGEGRPVHPVLYGLYHQVNASGYEIQVELSMQRSTLRAVGFCRIERHTEGAQKQVVGTGTGRWDPGPTMIDLKSSFGPYSSSCRKSHVWLGTFPKEAFHDGLEVALFRHSGNPFCLSHR